MTHTRRDFLKMVGGTVAYHAAKPIKPPRPHRVRNALVTITSGRALAAGSKTYARGNFTPLPPGVQVWPVLLLTGE